ncbi:integrase core domain-containing protein [Streptomyces sp. NPDC056669]|uniref:integrase core domain-containing protein n=1 Tax=unclassified Streptomyces TaxID=2593676 RepID=UPI0036AC8E46
MNAIAEHWTGSCRREATDPALITGERHLRRLVGEYTEHYNRHRPHRTPGPRSPSGPRARRSPSCSRRRPARTFTSPHPHP